MRLYSVYDKVSQRYNAPYSEVNDAAAVRSFNLACRDSKSLLGMAPTDFFLIIIPAGMQIAAEIRKVIIAIVILLIKKHLFTY